MSASPLRVGQVGLGYWGKNLVRNFDDLSQLTWLCDSDAALRADFAHRSPDAQVTGDVDEMLAAPDLDAVVIATHHAAVNYRQLAEWADCIVDSRNAMAGVETKPGQLWKA